MMKSKNYSMQDLSKIIVKNLLVIIIFTILGGGAFGLLAKHKRSTTYTAERSVVVSHNFSNANKKNDVVNADLSMTSTYSDMINGREVTNKAYKLLSKKMRKEYTRNQIAASINSETHPESLVISIKAHGNSAKDAVAIVNATTDAAKLEIPKMQPGAGNVHVYPKATESSVVSKTTPSTKKYVVIGSALGLLFGMIIAFAVDTWKKLI